MLCGCAEPEYRGIHHPITDSLVSLGSADARIDDGLSEDLRGRLSAALPLGGSAAVAAVKIPVGQRVIDAIALSRDRIALLLDPSVQIRIYDSAGQPIMISEGAGVANGPAFPVALVEHASGDLWLVSGNGKIWVYQIAAERMRLVRSLDVDMTPFDACRSGASIIIHGFTDEAEAVIHEVDDAGRQVHSYGWAYNARTRIVAKQLNRGRLLCAPGGRVLLALDRLPEVHAFSAEGRRLWIAAIAGHWTSLLMEEDEALVSGPRADSVDFLRSLVLATDGLALLQLHRFTRRDIVLRNRWPRLVTYGVRIADGSGGYVGDDLSMYLFGGSRLAATVSNGDAPYIYLGIGVPR